MTQCFDFAKIKYGFWCRKAVFVWKNCDFAQIVVQNNMSIIIIHRIDKNGLPGFDKIINKSLTNVV